MIFQKKFAEYKARIIEEARERAEALSQNIIVQPNRSGQLTNIARSLCFDVARLQTSEPRIRGYKEKREANDDPMSLKEIEVALVAATFPFDGSKESFAYEPSIPQMILVSASVEGGALRATFDDDASLDSSIDAFIRDVTQNLNQLREDMRALQNEALETMNEVCERRVAKIKEQDERNKTRKYKVDYRG